ncbi:hypothetical protein NKI56_12145 [Mesorhizobium sp. M0622]|uniref:hypothetical protein n=1 Tax=unclassified Mesorhizobium TaxID=325217 RepID=UPI0033376A45
MFVAMAAEKAELQQLRSETLKAEIVRMATLNEPAQERIADLHGIVKQLERAASVAAPRSSNVPSRPSPSKSDRARRD